MYSNFDKRQELARQTQTVQTFRRIRRGIGAVRNSRAKLALLTSIWMMAGILWLTRYPMMGYGSGTLFAPVLDALTVVMLLLLTAALSLALLWAWGGPRQAGRVQDDLLRIGLVKHRRRAAHAAVRHHKPQQPQNQRLHLLFPRCPSFCMVGLRR